MGDMTFNLPEPDILLVAPARDIGTVIQPQVIPVIGSENITSSKGETR
jgi:hypothetical protein